MEILRSGDVCDLEIKPLPVNTTASNGGRAVARGAQDEGWRCAGRLAPIQVDRVVQAHQEYYCSLGLVTRSHKERCFKATCGGVTVPLEDDRSEKSGLFPELP